MQVQNNTTAQAARVTKTRKNLVSIHTGREVMVKFRPQNRFDLPTGERMTEVVVIRTGTKTCPRLVVQKVGGFYEVFVTRDGREAGLVRARTPEVAFEKATVKFWS